MKRWIVHGAAVFLTGAAALGGFGPTAMAQAREFPPAALRGKLVIGNPPEVTLDGQPARLAPGARIRAANNMLVMSGGLSGQRLLVNYLRDGAGQIREVWILSTTEAREKRVSAEPASNLISSAEEQKRLDAAGKTSYDQQPKYPQR